MPFAAVLAAAAGWTFTPSPFLDPDTVATYRLDSSVCGRLLPKLYEDSLLTWSSFGCDDVRAIVRESFDEWEYNGRLSFEEVTADSAQVTVRVEHISIPSTLATATRYSTHAVITLDRSECWYTDRAFCASVRDNVVLVWFLLGLVWFFSASVSAYLLCRRRTSRR